MITRRLLPFLTIVLAATLAACGQADIITFIPEGGSYAAGDLPALLADADLKSAAALTEEEASEARQRSLSELRAYGADAALLADTLTRDLPPDAGSVPVIVEYATFDATPAWIVIEAAPDDAGTLTYRRLWVFSATERAVIAAISSR